jgi:phosphatidylinositol alpha-1,6-mannosyltransferase
VLGVEERVTFAGRVDDTTRLALYDRCDVFVMVSRQEVDGSAEGFGIVFLEAAARGKPAVGGRSGGIPDAIEDGVTGLLVDSEDPPAIADACVRLLTDAALGAAGRARVAGQFTWEQVAARVERVLQEGVRAAKRHNIRPGSGRLYRRRSRSVSGEWAAETMRPAPVDRASQGNPRPFDAQE